MQVVEYRVPPPQQTLPPLRPSKNYPLPTLKHIFCGALINNTMLSVLVPLYILESQMSHPYFLVSLVNRSVLLSFLDTMAQGKHSKEFESYFI
jgi:hypothetical protein